MEASQHHQPPGVIFDLDGTLADTLDDIARAVNDAFAQVGHPPVDRARVESHIGEPLAELLRSVSGTEDADTIANLVSLYRTSYGQCLLEKTVLYPGIADVLDALTERGCPLGVLSNKPDEFAVTICERLLAPWPFKAVLGAREQSPRKPDPQTALQMADKLDRSPGKVFFVGDSAADVHTAANAGMIGIAVTWGYRGLPELRAAGPSAWANSPRDLLSAILGRSGSSRTTAH